MSSLFSRAIRTFLARSVTEHCHFLFQSVCFSLTDSNYQCGNVSSLVKNSKTYTHIRALPVRVLGVESLISMNGREHDIIEVVGKTGVWYLIALPLCPRAALLYPGREELQKGSRIQ